MTIKIGINGFGRVGKGLFRIIAEKGDKSGVEVLAIRDFNNGHHTDEEYIKNIAYLLHSDSIYGPFPQKVGVDGSCLVVGKKRIPIFLSEKITDVDWDKLGVDILVEASGAMVNINRAGECLRGGVKKVVITRGAPNVDFTLVLGVNEEMYDPQSHHVISSSTCTGNAFAPIAKVLDERYRIINGFVSTIHPVLSYEKMLDGPHKSFALGRATKTIKPVETAIVQSIETVLPHLKGRLCSDALSYRIPTDIVSAIYAIITLKKKSTKEELVSLFMQASKKTLKNIIYVCEGLFGHPLVGVDFLKNPHSAIIDRRWMSVNDNLVRLHIWHDNEYGYCCRVFDVIKLLLQ